jgi:hypothetical protein
MRRQQFPHRTQRQARVTGALGLGLVLLPLAWLNSTRTRPPGEGPVTGSEVRFSSQSPSGAARRAACQAWVEAEQAVNRQCEALEAWDPQADTGAADFMRRRELLAQDRSGNLLRARHAAKRAAALARSPREAYQAALLLVRIEHDMGHYQAELDQARRLTVLAPGSRISRTVMEQALKCHYPGCGTESCPAP